MLGGEVPDLHATPCGGCGEPFTGDDVVVWDPWHRGDPRLAAYPFHRQCAGDVLPLESEAGLEHVCGLCQQRLDDAEWLAAVAALRERVREAKAPAGQLPRVAWRLAAREPARRWIPDHLACLLDRAGGGQAPGALPGRVAKPDA